MAHIITCDVCDARYTPAEWKRNPGITAKIPARLLGDTDVPAGEYTFCDWDCLGALAQVMREEGDEEEEVLDSDEAEIREVGPVPPTLAEAIATGQIHESSEVPPQPKLVQVPVAGIRVDGRPLQ